MLAVYGMILPITIVGFYYIGLIVDAIFKVRSGWVKVWKLLPNDQTKKFWVKPEGKKIKLKAKNPYGVLDETSVNVRLDKGWLWREGGTPFIKLDANNVQIPWEVNRVEEIPKEVVDEMADTAFAAGMMAGFKGGRPNKLMMTLLFIAIIAIVASIGVSYYMWSSIHVYTQAVTVQVVNDTGAGMAKVV